MMVKIRRMALWEEKEVPEDELEEYLKKGWGISPDDMSKVDLSRFVKYKNKVYPKSCKFGWVADKLHHYLGDVLDGHGNLREIKNKLMYLVKMIEDN